jgi:O-antigen/teichoic acid export membrane protein
MNRSVILTIAARIVAVVFLFGATVLVARCLGPEGQGRYFVAVTFAALIVQFANLGLHSSNTYLLARDQALLAPLLANSVWASLVLGGGVAAFVVIACQVTGWNVGIDTDYLWLGAAIVPPRMFYIFGTSLLVGLNQIRAFNLMQIGSSLAVFCALSVIGVLGGSAGAFLVMTLVTWTFMAIALLIMLLRATRESLTFRRDILQAGFRYSTKAYFACLLAFLMLRSNIFLLQTICGDKEVGLYSIAAQAADVLNLVPSSLAVVLFPQLVKDETQSWDRMLCSLWKVAAFMLLACCFSALFVSPAVHLIFGRQYSLAAEMLLYMLPGVFFLGLVSVVSQYLAAIAFPRRVLDIWLATVVLQVFLCVLLIPRYAGLGAAMALSIAYSVNFVLQLFLAYTCAGRVRVRLSAAPA